jgi:hypothetical protein
MIQAIPRTRHTIQLGQWQRAYLLAIQAIEHKEGIKSYPLREVTACVVRNSVDLQLFLQKQKKNRARRWAEAHDLAQQRDDPHLLALIAKRKSESKRIPLPFEPSKIVASLEKRGLISIKKRGLLRLTKRGRDVSWAN